LDFIGIIRNFVTVFTDRSAADIAIDFPDISEKKNKKDLNYI
jgi:hypothetical protein